MSEHPIEGLMRTAMNSIQDMVDVNTIIGEPIETAGDIMIIPISKVCFGFAAGGSEFNTETLDEYKKKEKEEEMQYRLPFGGGSGAGVTINPVAFLVINKENIKLMPISHSSTVDKIVDYIPDILDKFIKNKNGKDEDIEEKNENSNIELKAEIQKEEISNDYLEDE
jgi:sporulation protein YtfJ